MEMAGTVFLDRDGTLIRDTGYLSSIRDVEILSGVVSGLKMFLSRNYRLHIVSNQSGIPRGLVSTTEFQTVERYFIDLFQKNGVQFDSLNYCFHLASAGCSCRKPQTGLFEAVSVNFQTDKKRAAMVGNSLVDMEAAEKFGIAYWGVEQDKTDFLQVAQEVIDYFETFE